jgi:hypothetical protein
MMAFVVPPWVPKLISGPALAWVRDRRPVQLLRARVARAAQSFALPRGMTYIHVPGRPDGKGGFVPSDQERAAADLVQEMLRAFGLREGRDWKEHRVRAEQPIPDEVRRSHLIVIGEMDAPFLTTLIGDFSSLLELRHGFRRGRPWFEWRSARFEAPADRDYGYLAVVRNPYEKQRRAVLLLGLGGLGAYGAAKLFAEPSYQATRREVQQLARLEGSLEAVLDIRPAKDGIAKIEVAERPSAAPAEHGLAAVLPALSKSIEAYHRTIGLSKLTYTCTVKANYDLLVEEEVTLVATSKDILVLNKPYAESVHGKPIPDLGFVALVVDGTASESVLNVDFEPDASHRTYVVFPVPPVEVGSSRRFRFSVLWPGGAHRLRDDGNDIIDLAVSAKAEGKVDVVSVRIRFEDPAASFTVTQVPEAVAGSGGRFRIHEPFVETLTDVPPGRRLVYRVFRA